MVFIPLHRTLLLIIAHIIGNLSLRHAIANKRLSLADKSLFPYLFRTYVDTMIDTKAPWTGRIFCNCIPNWYGVWDSAGPTDAKWARVVSLRKAIIGSFGIVRNRLHNKLKVTPINTRVKNTLNIHGDIHFKSIFLPELDWDSKNAKSSSPYSQPKKSPVALKHSSSRGSKVPIPPFRAFKTRSSNWAIPGNDCRGVGSNGIQPYLGK